MPEADGSCEIIYNGACPVCRDGVQAIRHPTAACYTDITADAEALRAHALTAEDVQYRLHARTPDGKIVRGIDAVAILLSTSRSWHWAGRLARVPVLRQLGWACYEATAFLLFHWNKRKGNF